jgi:hypothetical protein
MSKTFEILNFGHWDLLSFVFWDFNHFILEKEALLNQSEF